MFAFSVAQNVAVSSVYDEKFVWSCLDKAGVSQRIIKLADGLNTTIYKQFDENGVDISGGEEQKIAIARALYRNASIVILDEPTAALDPVSEFEIYERFHAMIGNKTSLFI